MPLNFDEQKEGKNIIAQFNKKVIDNEDIINI